MNQNVSRPEAFTKALGEGASRAFGSLSEEILKEGALSVKEKALIAVACAAAVGCEYCVKKLSERALAVGASRREIIEAAAVAGLVRAGSGFAYASNLLDDGAGV